MTWGLIALGAYALLAVPAGVLAYALGRVASRADRHLDRAHEEDS